MVYMLTCLRHAHSDATLLSRRNNRSSFNATMSDQMLGKLAAEMQDPLLGRASGALVVGTSTPTPTRVRTRTFGSNGGYDGALHGSAGADFDDEKVDALSGAGAAEAAAAPFSMTNSTHMQSSAPSKQHTVTIFTHTAVGTASDEAFIAQLDSRAASSTPAPAARANHTAWWKQFWNRSWVILETPAANDPDQDAAGNITEAYWLNRYLVAIQSRGSLPMHHNGGTVTWGYDGKTHSNPDARSVMQLLVYRVVFLHAVTHINQRLLYFSLAHAHTHMYIRAHMLSLSLIIIVSFSFSFSLHLNSV